MALRGPQRDPNSRRGQAEIRRREKLQILDALARESEPQSSASESNSPLLPRCPRGLPPSVAETWQILVTELAAAKVPLAQIDTHAIAATAERIDAMEQGLMLSRDGKLDADQRLAALARRERAAKDLLQWLAAICATPGSRIGKPVLRPEKPLGPLAKMLAARTKRA